MPKRVMSDEELRQINRAGEGFVYNDNWSRFHRASCGTLKTAKVYVGPEDIYENPGLKMFDSSRESLVEWANWWLSDSPENPLKACESCRP